MKQLKLPPLDRVLLRLLLLRVILPSMVLILVAIVLVGYLMTRDIGDQQLQLVRSLARLTDDYLEHASQVLNAVAKVAEISAPETLASYMQATWEVYGYFDALYRLDEKGIVVALTPPDSGRQGTDMSSQVWYDQTKAQAGVTVSQPLTSQRTGRMTVYMAHPLADGGLVVGELDLETQRDALVAAVLDYPGHDSVFVVDRSGVLLAHSRSDQVGQPASLDHFYVVQHRLTDATTSLYVSDEGIVVGSAAPMARSEWTIVAEVPLVAAYGPYIQAVGPLLLLVPVVWAFWMWNLRHVLKRHVVAPLARLSRGADALAAGDFARGEELATIPAAFTEVNTMGANFYRMSQAIQARQRALQESEERLRGYTRRLEARNEELDAFGHTVAHDLKSPLNLIVGYAQVLREEYASLTDEDLRDYLRIIVRTGTKMSNIIDELLLLAGVRKVEVKMVPLDMASIVAESQQRLAHMIEEYQAEVILPQEWPVALGYGPWVEEVWVNYISNALRHGGRPAEGVPPRVELGYGEPANQQIGELANQQASSDSQIRFWVRDNGRGLTPKEQERLFTPFTRLDQVRTKGHGLGLSIVRRIVEKMDGQVGVESTVGQGSVFSFTLPRAASNAMDPTVKQRTGPATGDIPPA